MIQPIGHCCYYITDTTILVCYFYSDCNVNVLNQLSVFWWQPGTQLLIVHKTTHAPGHISGYEMNLDVTSEISYTQATIWPGKMGK